jgi:AcrR family transcriptional regulator
MPLTFEFLWCLNVVSMLTSEQLPARRPRRSRREQTADNRIVLLDAAAAVFRARGYQAATLEQIADAAGFSKGVVYSQFASKADMFLAALAMRIDARADQNRATLDALDDYTPDNIAALTPHVFSRNDPQWRLAVTEFRIVASRDQKLRDRYDALHRRTVDHLASLLDGMYTRLGMQPPMATATLAALALGLDIAVVLEDASTARPISEHDLTVALRRLLFGDGEESR